MGKSGITGCVPHVPGRKRVPQNWASPMDAGTCGVCVGWRVRQSRPLSPPTIATAAAVSVHGLQPFPPPELSALCLARWLLDLAVPPLPPSLEALEHGSQFKKLQACPVSTGLPFRTPL